MIIFVEARVDGSSDIAGHIPEELVDLGIIDPARQGHYRAEHSVLLEIPAQRDNITCAVRRQFLQRGQVIPG